MITTVVFIIGCVIFAITVYGTVMAGGTMLTRRLIETDPVIQDSPMIAARPLEDETPTDGANDSPATAPTG